MKTLKIYLQTVPETVLQIMTKASLKEEALDKLALSWLQLADINGEVAKEKTHPKSCCCF